MKKIFLGLGLSLFSAFSNAQNGLQNVIVEKYYIANAADSASSVGTLPVGSITYRVFVDMKQGYNFQMAYGDANHELFFKTTTSFFNNEDRGSITPNYTKTQARNNTVMLDSWLSVGAACVGNFGILKSEDNGINNVVNANGILQNDTPSLGIPLTTQDGLLAGSPGTFGTIGMDSAIAAVFDATSQAGNLLSTMDGAWFCLGGAVGPDTTNKVLIAQITTNGKLTFELNIQLGDSNGGIEKYVAKNPADAEIKRDFLTFNSDSLNRDTINHSNISLFGKNNEISVFPNPTNDFFNLDINSVKNNSDNFYSIYNIIGNVLLTKKIENISDNYKEIIDMSSYAKGIYFIEISLNNERLIKKLIVN